MSVQRSLALSLAMLALALLVCAPCAVLYGVWRAWRSHEWLYLPAGLIVAVVYAVLGLAAAWIFDKVNDGLQ